MKLPIVSGKDVAKVLLKEGFILKKQKGSRMHFIKEQESKLLHVDVPIHGNKDLNTTVLMSIMRQSGYSRDDFIKLFR
ncbi:MAG: type II toxin-antitoxin system HicA family toxin [Candidatus Micrarchaeota archaeon]